MRQFDEPLSKKANFPLPGSSHTDPNLYPYWPGVVPIIMGKKPADTPLGLTQFELCGISA